MWDLVLFPHCDLHVALNGTPPLRISAMARDAASPPDHLTLTNVTPQCQFDFFAPHNAVGNRFQNFVDIDPATGVVTPLAMGTNLVQVRHPDRYLVFRIQVHDRVQGWWFGNASMTTPRDARFAHAQPSIYALFSEDASGVDRVGDITGHGYVTLTSNDPGVFTVNPQGRLQGVAAGSGTLRGSFLGVDHTLPVRTVDYAARRDELEAVRTPNVAGFAAMHNIVFLAEGFRDTPADRALFDEMVTKAADKLFTSGRHQPYGLLRDSFNVWKAWTPSQQHGVTCGFRITTSASELAWFEPGYPIPYTETIGSDPTKDTIEALVRKVGLPKRNETRAPAAIIADWNARNLPGFDAAKVTEDLVKVWKAQKADGLLEARDTFFGIHFGARYAEGAEGAGPAVTRPASEAGDPMKAYIARMHEWYGLRRQRLTTPDPRREPPELNRAWNQRVLLTQFLGSLHTRAAPHHNVGAEWAPELLNAPSRFRPSIGLVGLVVHDGFDGGARFGFVTASSVGNGGRLAFTHTTTGVEHPMRRAVPDPVASSVDDFIDTIAHEFGHSFNLSDEYEEYPGDDPAFRTDPNVDDSGDNVARLAAVFANGTVSGGQVTFTDRTIDPDKVKWLQLLRPSLSSRLVADSTEAPDGLHVKVEPRLAASWTAAKQKGLEAFLRARDITPSGRQLPLQSGEAHTLVRLAINRVDEATGTIVLGGLGLPSRPFPTYPAGSLLFVPQRDGAGELRYVAAKAVRQRLAADKQPLNQDRDTTKVNTGKDSPVPIAVGSFKPPCKSYKLVGVYEGAGYYTAGKFRPAGACKMRSHPASGGEGEFCHVCKYLITLRVDPGQLAALDDQHYPGAKKGE